MPKKTQKRLTIIVDEYILKNFKKRCIDKNISVGAYVEKLMKKELQNA